MKPPLVNAMKILLVVALVTGFFVYVQADKLRLQCLLKGYKAPALTAVHRWPAPPKQPPLFIPAILVQP